MIELNEQIKWVLHFQGLDQAGPWKHINQVPAEFQYIERPKLSWGTGVYYVQSDGTLHLIESDYDSSD